MLRQGLVTCFWILVACVCLAAGRTTPTLSLHHHMTKRELQTIFGVGSHEQVPEYDIAQSFSVDGHNRHKRNSESSKSYELRAFGSSMHLNLELDPNVKSPNLVVRSYAEDGSRTDSTVDHVKLYTGHVAGHPGSRVTVKENNGLSGLIHLNDEAYFIHPLPERLAKTYRYSGDGQPHLVYRKLKPLSNQKLSRHVPHEVDDDLSKSSDSPLKVLEMTLVADQFVINVYRDETVEHLLMIAHIARSLFLDQTIGPIKINLVVVGIVLKKDGMGYNNTASSMSRLDALGRWSETNFPSLDSDPDHPDIVVLITRDIAGRASKRSTCSDTFGIAVGGDVGPATGLIVAHETAHTLGASHDGGRQCPDLKYIMSSVVAPGAAAFKWSNCSENTIQTFLRSAQSSCLNDEPMIQVESKYSEKYLEKLPGQVVDRDEQCRMMYSPRYFSSPHNWNNCSILACASPESSPYYYVKYNPPSDGTTCGPRHWCIKGECEDNGSPIIHGMWSGWSATYSPCSRPCGGGIRWRSRTCTSPSPQNGGKQCAGSAEGKWKLCNTQDCPNRSMDFRLKQCKAVNPKFEKVRYYHNEPCVLSCMIGSLSWRKGIVQDGTRCFSDHSNKNVCIKGRCSIASCDDSLDTGIKFDRCHVCDGDSSSCGQISGLWDAPCKGHGLAHECLVINIPVGALNVNVEKKVADINSVLGIKDSAGEFITKHMPSPTTVVDIQGTRVFYYRQEPKDRVFILGPTTIPLSIVNIPLYYIANKGVEYSIFFTNMTTEVLSSDVEWKVSDWSSCTRTCAGGTQVRAVECVRNDDGSHVGDYVCESAASIPAAVRACNTETCPQSWYTSKWSPCSKTCGKGFQVREIVCRHKISRDKYENLPDSSCSGEKPTGDLQKECNKVACPIKWVPARWSKCSTTCGVGVMNRNLLCKRRSSEGEMVLLHHLLCKYVPRPKTVQPCHQLLSCLGSPITLPPTAIYQPLGCYKDGKPNAIPELVINLRDSIDWHNLNKTIDTCAQHVHKYYPESAVFGIQFYGECWAGVGAENTYMKYGEAENCSNGVGTKDSIYVYRFGSR